MEFIPKDLQYDRSFASKRLRAIADAIDEQQSLLDIATRFSIPIELMHRLVSRRHGHEQKRSKVVDDQKLQFLSYRLKKGDSFWDVAKALNVSLATLRGAAKKHGVSARKLRTATREETIERAVFLYQEGNLPIDDIVHETGVKHATLYKIIKKRGVVQRRPR